MGDLPLTVQRPGCTLIIERTSKLLSKLLWCKIVRFNYASVRLSVGNITVLWLA